MLFLPKVSLPTRMQSPHDCSCDGVSNPLLLFDCGSRPALKCGTAAAVRPVVLLCRAGGSLMTAGASGGGSRPSGTGQQRGFSPMGSAAPSSQQQPQPFGSAALPAFGSPAAAPGSAGKPPMQQHSPGGGSRLFEGLQPLPAASVLGSPPAVAPAAAGPFGAAAVGVTQDAAAPVFGLQVRQQTLIAGLGDVSLPCLC